MTKNLVMQNVFRIRSVDCFKKIVISHDMTPMERQECKRLVNEAKEKESNDESGDYIYRVRGLPNSLRVVKIKKRTTN